MLHIGRLRVLSEVVHRGSFSAAAESLSYTQSAVSQAVARLEAETGATLVVRDRRGVRPRAAVRAPRRARPARRGAADGRAPGGPDGRRTAGRPPARGETLAEALRPAQRELGADSGVEPLCPARREDVPGERVRAKR